MEFQPAAHQVGGHKFSDGLQGSLQDGKGKFFKPLQSGDRGDAEVGFFQSMYTAAAREMDVDTLNGSLDTDRIHRKALELFQGGARPEDALHSRLVTLTPTFHGEVEGPDGLRLMGMEDVTFGYTNPTVFDLKMGYRTWYEGADPEWIERNKGKDARTSQGALGYRICGVKVYDQPKAEYWESTKKWCQTLETERVPEVLGKCLTNGAAVNANSLLKGPAGLLQKLEDIAAWFEVQQEYLFCSASVLVAYEGALPPGEVLPGQLKLKVRLIDFAHSFPLEPEKRKKDENVLSGLRSLISALKGYTSDDV